MPKIKAKPAISQDEQTDKIAKLEAMCQRAVADYQNLEKRTVNERQQFVKLANRGLITELLPVLDGLERAAEHTKDQGLELIYKQLVSILNNEGLMEIPALNLPFDPNKMECVEQISGPQNQVMRVAIKGYVLNEAVLRPAKVAVGNNS